jgi:uridine kinase
LSNKVVIKVYGPPQSGKSSIARLISYYLANEGIPSGVSDQDQDYITVGEARRRLTIKDIRINIEVIQTNREGNDGPVH